MSILTSVAIYTLTILFTPVVLLFYREGARALLTFLLSLTVIGFLISIPIGIVTVRGHRKVQKSATP